MIRRGPWTGASPVHGPRPARRGRVELPRQSGHTKIPSPRPTLGELRQISRVSVRSANQAGLVPARFPRSPSPERAVAVAYVCTLFMTATDMQIVNVALPTMSRDFGEPLSAVISYLLTLAVVIPASGWIGDRVGTKRTFLFALVLFTVASGLCGVSQSLPQLIAARALQGVGGGLLTPTGTAMLFRAYGPERRRRRRGRRRRPPRASRPPSTGRWRSLPRDRPRKNQPALCCVWGA